MCVCVYIYIYMYAEYMYVQYLIPSPILNIPRNKPYLGPKSRDVQFYNMIQIPRKILATIQVPHSVSITQRVPCPSMSHLRNRRGLAESSCCASYKPVLAPFMECIAMYRHLNLKLKGLYNCRSNLCSPCSWQSSRKGEVVIHQGLQPVKKESRYRLVGTKVLKQNKVSEGDTWQILLEKTVEDTTKAWRNTSFSWGSKLSRWPSGPSPPQASSVLPFGQLRFLTFSSSYCCQCNSGFSQ